MRAQFLLLFFLFGYSSVGFSQHLKLTGHVQSADQKLSGITVRISGIKQVVQTDSSGFFSFSHLKPANYQMRFSGVGYQPYTQVVNLSTDTLLNVALQDANENLNEVVVTGTQKEVNRLDSPVPVEVYSAKFFQRNPTPCLFDALQNINGVRPQLNCNICNTGDIHINGLEGPYTMVLIDGMPIVSSLSTVYGLSGIPNALVERVEVVKGPASSLYGSEAVGGLINIITKKTSTAPSFSFDFMATDYKEFNQDLGVKFNMGSRITALTGINYFKYGNPVDLNGDNFTDVTLQDRISIFQKLDFKRSSGKAFSLAGRFMYEDRWGGEMNWTKADRGGTDVYGESIYTKRFELIGNYQLPVQEKMFLSFSLTDHNQDSRYGSTSYIAKQNISFAQLTWDKTWRKHDVLFGAAFRYTFYDDNTPATASASSINPVNQPEKIVLPGLFVQDEIKFNPMHSLLLGARYDYHSVHGNIFTPRLAYKIKFPNDHIVRLNAGTGFRVVNIFTEDHAALTGARDVIIKNDLNPERTYNVNLNYLKRFVSTSGSSFGVDVSAFYTYFNNRIIGDFDTNPNQIIYDNLDGHAVSQGLTFNFDVALRNGIRATAGLTYQDVSFTENGIKQQQILTEKVMGTWSVSYKIQALNLNIDYTGNVYGPMRLPLLSDLDPRNPMSPTWSIQNIQFTFDGFKNLELYGGIKNLLNFTPNQGNPFLIARSNDPFDKNVQFDASGKVIPTSDNPYALTFDPSYVYAPNQGIRGFFGVRYTLK